MKNKNKLKKNDQASETNKQKKKYSAERILKTWRIHFGFIN